MRYRLKKLEGELSALEQRALEKLASSSITNYEQYAEARAKYLALKEHRKIIERTVQEIKDDGDG